MLLSRLSKVKKYEIKTDLEVVNIGLKMFKDNLQEQGVKVNQVEFFRPAD